MDENGPAVDASRCKKSKHSVNIVLEIKDVHIVTTALPVTIWGVRQEEVQLDDLVGESANCESFAYEEVQLWAEQLLVYCTSIAQ